MNHFVRSLILIHKMVENIEMKTKEAETVTLEFYCGNFILTTVTTWGSYLMG